MFDHIARLASKLTGAQSAVVGTCDSAGVYILGNDGFDWRILDPKWSLRFLATERLGVVYVKDVRRDARMRRHPMRLADPSLRSLIYLPIDVSGCARGAGEWGAGITIFNPDAHWLLNTATTVYLSELGHIVKAALLGPPGGMPIQKSAGGAGLSEELGEFTSPPDAAGQFLLETWSRRVAWHNRRGQVYTTVRAWRAPIKKYQFAALVALKAAPTEPFTHAVANDIATAAKVVFGETYFDCVVSVPCGHSSGPHCFSSLLAKRVSAILSVAYLDAFERQQRAGKSHPRRNAALAPFKLRRKPRGRVLLVDDVATTGKHLEHAIIALKPHVDHVMAIAWIGGK